MTLPNIPVKNHRAGNQRPLYQHDSGDDEGKGSRHGLPSVLPTADSAWPENVRKESPKTFPDEENDSPAKSRVRKLSLTAIQDLTSSPLSLPLPLPSLAVKADAETDVEVNSTEDKHPMNSEEPVSPYTHANGILHDRLRTTEERLPLAEDVAFTSSAKSNSYKSELLSRRIASSPVLRRKFSSGGAPNGVSEATRRLRSNSVRLSPTETGNENLKSRMLGDNDESQSSDRSPNSETPLTATVDTVPLPPFSIPAYLELELSSEVPSPLYIRRSVAQDFPYEESKARLDRLLNFLRLPVQLEQVLLFGTLACLDAWLYTFTILPIRFLRALWMLFKWWLSSARKESASLSSFTYHGLWRVWQRVRQPSEGSGSRRIITGESKAKRQSIPSMPRSNGLKPDNKDRRASDTSRSIRRPSTAAYRYRRSKSTPSALRPSQKADLLQGLLFAISCVLLTRFDASRMYHSIRGQAAIKLYVIYNVLEVCDRLLAALGQDVMECLISRETLDRNASGRSKVMRPLLVFLLALVYNVVHAAALFYQIITLNVAVNSYSNALLTLLISNQFVEIKGTVFKKFEKESLFQLTCADVVERFQIWLMLTVIALRNLMEIGVLSFSSITPTPYPTSSVTGTNATGLPIRSTSILPQSFTLLPSRSGQVLGPFVMVVGSEMIVDWLKHAYISKFNNTKPEVYGRFFDVLAKDYYSHAFVDQNLTKRLGLPVMPLACLFVRAIVQTYHMFLATHMQGSVGSSATSLSVGSEAAAASPATTAALAHIDKIFRRALSGSSFGATATGSGWSLENWSFDDMISVATLVVIFLVAYLILLSAKLLLSMGLLSLARNRYQSMTNRETKSGDTTGRRVGGFGLVEVGEDKRAWIYADDPNGARALREREARAKEKEAKGDLSLDNVDRYSMVAKRIW